jgi:hypothetical protein
MFRRFLLCAALLAAPAPAAENHAGLAMPAAPVVGHIYASDAFQTMPMSYIGDFDRLNRDFDLLDGELLRARRDPFDGDAEPEWLLMSPERLCGNGGCLYVLFDGKTAREIGRFSGTLIVLHRQQNGYPVIQTITQQDASFSSLRTFVFADRQYQVDDEVLIGEAVRLRMESTLEIRH